MYLLYLLDVSGCTSRCAGLRQSSNQT